MKVSRKDQFTYEEHEKLAASVLKTLEGIGEICNMLHDAPPDDGTSYSLRWTRSPKLVSRAIKAGIAADNLRRYLEGLLSSQDHTDLRSWPLYYPRDSKVGHTHYGR